MEDPIRYIGLEKADIRFYDGALRHAVGAKHYQVVRANREHPESQEDYGWTYNHAPMLCYWNEHFWIEYLSNPVSEHLPPSHTLLTWSRDGETWSKPVVIFPQYALPEGVYTGPKKELIKPGDTAVMHQRMGFYVSQEGRLLVLGFYGVAWMFTPAPTTAMASPGVGGVPGFHLLAGLCDPLQRIRWV